MSDTDLDHNDETDAPSTTDGDAELVETKTDDRDASADEPTPVPRRRRPDWGLLAACLVIAGGLLAIAWGVGSAITGTDGVERPDAIEDLAPVENAQQVFQQEQVLVDLQFGYEAVLIIDGIELPVSRIGEFSGDLTPENAGTQVSAPPTAVFDPGNSILTFRPGDDALIQEFSEGLHQAQVIFWKSEEGRANGQSYRWTFNVI
ncbi:MAG: hypothetical protein AB8G14_00295 [Ilumatobacter sp.]